MKTTLYRAYDDDGRLLYVGISKDVYARLGMHGHGAAWTHHAVRITFEQFEARDDAAAAELRAIRTEDPVWNMSGRPIERYLQWMAAYPHQNPDDIDVDRLVADMNRQLVGSARTAGGESR